MPCAGNTLLTETQLKKAPGIPISMAKECPELSEDMRNDLTTGANR